MEKKDLGFSQEVWKLEKTYLRNIETWHNTNYYVPNSIFLNHCLQILKLDIFVLLLCMMRESPILFSYYLSILWGGGVGGKGFRGFLYNIAKENIHFVIYS